MCWGIRLSWSRTIRDTWFSRTLGLCLSRSQILGLMKLRIPIARTLGASCMLPTVKNILSSRFRRSRKFHCSLSTMRPSNSSTRRKVWLLKLSISPKSSTLTFRFQKEPRAWLTELRISISGMKTQLLAISCTWSSSSIRYLHLRCCTLWWLWLSPCEEFTTTRSWSWTESSPSLIQSKLSSGSQIRRQALLARRCLIFPVPSSHISAIQTMVDR